MFKICILFQHLGTYLNGWPNHNIDIYIYFFFLPQPSQQGLERHHKHISMHTLTVPRERHFLDIYTCTPTHNTCITHTSFSSSGVAPKSVVHAVEHTLNCQTDPTELTPQNDNTACLKSEWALQSSCFEKAETLSGQPISIVARPQGSFFLSHWLKFTAEIKGLASYYASCVVQSEPENKFDQESVLQALSFFSRLPFRQSACNRIHRALLWSLHQMLSLTSNSK